MEKIERELFPLSHNSKWTYMAVKSEQREKQHFFTQHVGSLWNSWPERWWPLTCKIFKGAWTISWRRGWSMAISRNGLWSKDAQEFPEPTQTQVDSASPPPPNPRLIKPENGPVGQGHCLFPAAQAVGGGGQWVENWLALSLARASGSFQPINLGAVSSKSYGGPVHLCLQGIYPSHNEFYFHTKKFKNIKASFQKVHLGLTAINNKCFKTETNAMKNTNAYPSLLLLEYLQCWRVFGNMYA